MRKGQGGCGFRRAGAFVASQEKYAGRSRQPCTAYECMLCLNNVSTQGASQPNTVCGMRTGVHKVWAGAALVGGHHHRRRAWHCDENLQAGVVD